MQHGWTVHLHPTIFSDFPEIYFEIIYFEFLFQAYDIVQLVLLLYCKCQQNISIDQPSGTCVDYLTNTQWLWAVLRCSWLMYHPDKYRTAWISKLLFNFEFFRLRIAYVQHRNIHRWYAFKQLNIITCSYKCASICDIAANQLFWHLLQSKEIEVTSSNSNWSV